jgi:flavin-dependent dehydrogenase
VSPATVRADVLVVGAGLAGLRTAAGLAARGHDVILVDRRPDLAGGIRTTGIFVHRTLADFPLPPALLGPPIRRLVLYPPSRRRSVVLTSPRDEFRVGRMPQLCTWAGERATAAGVTTLLGTTYEGREDGLYRLSGPHGTTRVRARFVVGADGARSRVARDLGLDRNRRLLVGAEETYAVTGAGVPPAFHCVVDPVLAPGYLAWVVNDGEHVHVGTAGWPARYRNGLREALRGFVAHAPGLDGVVPAGPVERRAGPIPVGGVLRRIGGPRGLLVGDAAGAVSPLTAGGLDPCLRLSDHAVEALDEALCRGRPDALRDYDGQDLRRRFTGRRLMRSVLDHLSSPALVEGGFRLLRTPPGRAAARSIVFDDRSFPLESPVHA